MKKLVLSQIVTMGDAASQFLGRCIPCKYEGRWHRYTRTANESVSGASDWHRESGRWPWVARIIDTLLTPLERQHCAAARQKDIERARELLKLNGCS